MFALDWRTLALATALIAALTGCPQPKPGTDRAETGPIVQPDSGEPEDGGPRDQGADTGVDPDAGGEDVAPGDATPGDGPIQDAMPPPPTVPSSFGTTSGGGRAGSTQYRIELITGAPAPMGRGESPSYRVLLGTGQQGR